MIIIKNGDSNVTKIINKKKLNKDTEYRISLFTYFYSENGKYLIQNTLTLEVAELTEQEWNAVQQIRKEHVSYDYIAANGLEQLAMSRYIVEKDYDEIAQYKNVVFVVKTVAMAKKGYSSYIIWPTTGCNARCIYCFEEGFKTRTMTPEIADKVIEFIKETKQDGKIKIKWFGGEPLLGHIMISYMCRKLKENNIEFESTMITNCSLVTEELAKEISKLWNMKKIQVSLDGNKADYEKRKRYCAPEKYNYDTVIRGIRFLAAEGLKINLRFNVDDNNIDGLAAFVDQLKADLSDAKNINMYLSPLFGVDKCRPSETLFKKMADLTEYCRNIGLIKTDYFKRDNKFKANYCMADSMDKTIGIGPDGEFNNCDSLLEKNVWGDLFYGITDQAKYDELYKSVDIDERCRECCFLPRCTPFYKQRCPLYIEECYDFKCMQTESYLCALMKGEPNTDDDDEEL
ncbi:Sulfatase maturation enzyme AslB, radical SAM superfamily [Ruminococcus flavefaciens]|uniref:Sulfatase maturation enzyme AslB, radical SAM superfamily n=1 Tax=Ruminococcus flavefaciens TaxID=1265 RepID=A0A1H6LHY8_RUMFL|nr:radical SAM protein [Ruminococcus flavefaciens]SEH88030.1 Sulfatase maturation enzyme AslB, radical SAM superfamily [Ruminococcus flavefaciens]